MGGYGAYVWISYVLCFFLFVIEVTMVFKSNKKLIKSSNYLTKDKVNEEKT